MLGALLRTLRATGYANREVEIEVSDVSSAEVNK